VERVKSEHGGDKGRWGEGNAGTPERQEKQQGRKRVEEKAGQVMQTGVGAEKLPIQDVRKERGRHPVAEDDSGERPANGAGVDA
jgi:hypothetical protein